MASKILLREHDLKKLKKATKLLKFLAHPVRLSILCHLNQRKEVSAGEMVEYVKKNASQSQVSQYLAQLRAMGLVTTRRDKQMIYYKLVSSETKAVLDALIGLYCAKP